MKTLSTYDRLVDQIPKCLEHAYDESLFLTVERLQWVALYEIDMYENDNDALTYRYTRRDIKVIRSWLAKVHAAIKAEGGDVFE
jgi:hypothetical protein